MNSVEQFIGSILHSNYPVFFTGAGISTNSGIPDFRGPKGFWKTNTPIMFQDFMSQESMRMKYWTQSVEFKSNFQEKIPNEGHTIISEVINSKKAGHCITQNVDNLHQKSGLNDASVTELHGNATFAVCLDCKKRFELSFIHEEFKSTNKSPKCDSCNGWVKTATISFGQPMPEDKMIIAHEETLKADVFVVAVIVSIMMIIMIYLVPSVIITSVDVFTCSMSSRSSTTTITSSTTGTTTTKIRRRRRRR